MILKLTKVTFNKVNKNKLIAIVNLDFEELKIKGFKLIKSQFENNLGSKLWLAPPTIKTGLKERPMFYYDDKECWGKICEQVYEEWEQFLQSDIKENEETNS